MSDQIKILIVGSIASVAFIIALGLMIHSCGTTVEVTCPNGGSATIIQKGQLGGEEAATGVCEELEGKGQ